MLTGWDISDLCHDDHVTHVGAWIEDFPTSSRPAPRPARCYYIVKTNFGDDDDFPGMADRVKVDVLGINLLQPLVIDPGGIVGAGADPTGGFVSTPGVGR